jgi:TPR repeat protein
MPWNRKPSAERPESTAVDVRTLAENGNPEAQFSLALQCEYSGGDEKSRIEAAGWFRRAADQGHTLAQFNLAVMYSTGEGVPLDESEAGRWFQRAASGGDAGAQFQMGKRSQRRSYGVPEKDATEARIESYKWFNLAAAQGYANSEAYVERSNLMLDGKEFAESQRRIAAFLAVPQPVKAG